MKMIWHIFVLIIAFGFLFIWEQSALVNYTIQILALLVATYIILSFIRRKRNVEQFSGSADVFILTTAILLLITITGNLYSPLFFLLYFLGFGITFIFEPISVFFFAVGTVIVFLPEALKNTSIESFIRLGSIFLIAPLAFFFGQEYRDRDEQEEEIQKMEERAEDTADTISSDVEEVLQKEKNNLKDEDVEKLNEILEETEELREESKN